MKMTSRVAAAISACALSFPGLAVAAVDNGGAPNGEISFGFGVMELDKDRTGIDDAGFGHYFTEYKSYYIGIGATVAL